MDGTIIAETNGADIAFNVSLRETQREALTQTAQPTALENMVYVTRTGSKYHLEGCSHLSEMSIALTMDEALEKYEPCSRCY